MAGLGWHVRRVAALLVGAPSQLATDRHTKHIFMAFAKKRHLVYFANIDTSKNDAHVVRGLTLGLSSGDSHHVFGSHDGYDMSLVMRSGRVGTKHNWVVMQFDLHTAVSLPHIILGEKNEVKPLVDSLKGIHRDLQHHLFIEPKSHHHAFAKRFTTYAPPAHAPLVEYVVSPELTRALAHHIRRIIIEIQGDSIFLSVDSPTLSVHYLDKMMHYGVVFAKHIDSRMGSA